MAVNDLNLEIGDGEFLVLVGPSGLRQDHRTAHASPAWRTITDGTLLIGDRVVNDVAPKDRDIAMVFQSYALYPHMSVYDNLAFGLKLRKTPKADIDAAGQGGGARSSASRSSSTASRRRSPAASASAWRSGGPSCASRTVFLMDEPLSNLDAKLRVQTRAEIAGCTSGSAPRRSTSPTTRSRR